MVVHHYKPERRDPSLGSTRVGSCLRGDPRGSRPFQIHTLEIFTVKTILLHRRINCSNKPYCNCSTGLGNLKKLSAVAVTHLLTPSRAQRPARAERTAGRWQGRAGYPAAAKGSDRAPHTAHRTSPRRLAEAAQRGGGGGGGAGSRRGRSAGPRGRSGSASPGRGRCRAPPSTC